MVLPSFGVASDFEAYYAWRYANSKRAEDDLPPMARGVLTKSCERLRSEAMGLSPTVGDVLPVDIDVKGSEMHAAIQLIENTDEGEFRAKLYCVEPIRELCVGSTLSRTVTWITRGESSESKSTADIGVVRSVSLVPWL